MKLGVDSTEACLHHLSPYPEKKHTRGKAVKTVNTTHADPFNHSFVM